MKEIERDRAAVRTLTDEGKTVTQIVKKLGRSRHFVETWQKRTAKKPLNIEDGPRSGRPTKVTKNVSLYLKRNMFGKPRASPRLMSQNLSSLGKNISSSTISRFAKRTGWKPYKLSSTSALTKKNKIHRVQYASKYLDLKVNDWKNWLFTDEKTFVLFRPPNKQNDRIYCYSPEERPTIFLPKKSQSVMVWGGMSYNGLTELEFVEKGKKINANTYVNTILEEAIPKLKKRTSTRSTSVVTRRMFKNPENFTFQQDGAPPHRAVLTQTWLAKNVHSFLPTREWPGNSPDLNPIENLWAHLAQNVSDRQPSSLIQLKEIIQEEWGKVEVEFLNRLIFSMPTRLRTVLAKKGGKTSY
jgi:transposase